MTKEALFRALGEVREEQIADADDAVKRKNPPWRRYGTAAACLAAVLAVGVAWNYGSQRDRWKVLTANFEPTPSIAENVPDSGGGADAGGLDGSQYWTEEAARPAPHYSVNVEIGELDPAELERERDDAAESAIDMDVMQLTPQEIFAGDTAIFRGVVRDMRYYVVAMNGVECGYTAASVEVADPIRGDLAAGETYTVLFPGGPDESICISGPLDRLQVGSDAIFMPVFTDSDTGWREGDSFFCYADLGELYLAEGLRYVFLDSEEGPVFARGVYPDIAAAETLEEVAAYIRRMVEPEREEARPAAVPAAPQPEPVTPGEEPSSTAQAGPPSAVRGPAGARALPGGAVVGE